MLSSSGIYSYTCSLVHSELSWWGLKSSLHLQVAHTHYGSHYSVRSVFQHVGLLPVPEYDTWKALAAKSWCGETAKATRQPVG
jgi:hypothetical protein